MSLPRALLRRWTWRMAWRDGRREAPRLLLFAAAMAIGVGALVAIGSFGATLSGAIEEKSRELLGADLRVRTNGPFPPEVEELIAPLEDRPAARTSRQLSFTSMAFFPRPGAARLVRVRAIDGDYPFYGDLGTEPAAAAATFRAGRKDGGGGPAALVDQALIEQLGLLPGDALKIGDVAYRIEGALARIPGESATAALFGPRVYVPLEGLDPQLLERGSRVEHALYFRFEDGFDADAWRDEWRDAARDLRARVDTPRSTGESMGRTVDDVRGFLGLVGFVALLLGALAVGSAVAVHVRRRIPTVATLRCLGATSTDAFAVHLAQALVLGVAAGLLGVALGAAVVRILPLALRDFLPLDVTFALAPGAAALGAAQGVAFALLFALLALLPLRRVAPILAVRAGDAARGGPAGGARPPRDRARLALLAVLVLMVFCFAAQATGEVDEGALYTGALAASFGLLALTARGLAVAARRFAPRSLPFALRQGLANLHRPHNQTTLLLVAVGLAVLVLTVLAETRALLMAEIESVSGENQPNVVLFDVQRDQLADVEAALARLGTPPIEQAPIVTMRLERIHGTAGAEDGDDRGRRSRWAMRREYRSTYRDRLTDLERVIRGRFVPRAPDDGSPVPITLEEDIAEDLRVDVGDRLDWDVQGLPVRTVVTGIRSVDWRHFRPNFFAVFPAGVLEDAPRFHALVVRAEDAEAVARVQRAVAEEWPNVSVVDVRMLLDAADELLGKAAFAIHFMAGFALLTGLLVLVAAISTTRRQRIEESALLRTLGASRRLAQRVVDVEYLALGGLGALSGLVLGAAFALGLARWRFDLDAPLEFTPMIVLGAAIPLLTWLVGRTFSRRLHGRPPLEVLREEAAGG